MRYVKVNLSRGLSLGLKQKPSNLFQAYDNADDSNEFNTWRSTRVFAIIFSRSKVCWWTRKQWITAISRTKPECMGMCNFTKHVVLFSKLLFNLNQKPMPSTEIFLPPMELFNDNNGAAFLSKEAAKKLVSKHSNIRNHHILGLVASSIITSKEINMNDRQADYFKKFAFNKVLDKCRVIMGNISAD